ncbi:MAG: hypothetical protein CBC34_010010 [Hyphomicrobiaceae bacterium TMED74]|nr:hypothetical protein [Filomicrobium sp.]RPG41544.1 MAG: hypothetical protein CBC34_010010 [Hyphomicrobiaceae bacterium TMED74]
MYDTSKQSEDEAVRDHRQSDASALPSWPSVALGLVYIGLLAIAYAFGLFEMIGPGLLQSIDKIGLFGHLAFYGGLYAVVSLLLTALALLLVVIVFLVFRLFGIGLQVPALLPLQFFLVLWGAVIVIDIVAVVLVLPIFLGLILIWALVRVAGGPELGRLTIVGLLPMLAFGLGLLNGLQIADAPPSIQISPRGNPAPLSGQIVMSTAKGLVFFNKARGEAIYLPQASIEMANATEGQIERMNANRDWAKSITRRLEATLTEYSWNRVKSTFYDLREFIIRQFRPSEVVPQEQAPRRIG